MIKQAKSFGAEFITDTVINVDLSGTTKVVYGENDTYEGKSVISATGSNPRLLNVPYLQLLFFYPEHLTAEEKKVVEDAIKAKNSKLPEGTTTFFSSAVKCSVSPTSVFLSGATGAS